MIRKIGIVDIICLLLGNLSTSLTLAASPSFEKNLTAYLTKVSEIRGFEVTKDDIEYSLAYYGESLEDYESVTDLEEILEEVIKADYSNLQDIYEEYGLDTAKLEALLQNNGEELNDYVFVADVYEAVYTYGDVVQEEDFEARLEALLGEYSAKRGFSVTKEQIENTLTEYETTLSHFATVEELQDFLGEVILADGSNLRYFQDEYGLDQTVIVELLAVHGKKLEDYVFRDDLEFALAEYGAISDLFDFGELVGILESEFGLSEDEGNRLSTHLDSISDKLSQEETMERLLSLAERTMAFADFETMTELTAEQIAELASIYEEILSIFELKAAYTLISGETEKPLSLAELLLITDITNIKLKIDLYNTQGEFLADFIITGEVVDSGLIKDIGKDTTGVVKEVKKEEPAQKVQVKKPVKEVVKTVSGAKLPKTASDFLPNVMIGGLAMLIGGIMYRKVRRSA